jgi:hypothetical protein
LLLLLLLQCQLSHCPVECSLASKMCGIDLVAADDVIVVRGEIHAHEVARELRCAIHAQRTAHAQSEKENCPVGKTTTV